LSSALSISRWNTLERCFSPAGLKPTLSGFAFGTALSAAAAAGVVITVFRPDQDQRILGDVVSAHLLAENLAVRQQWQKHRTRHCQHQHLRAQSRTPPVANHHTPGRRKPECRVIEHHACAGSHEKQCTLSPGYRCREIRRANRDQGQRDAGRSQIE